MNFLVTILAIWVSVEPINSMSYPIFGTKRYHRGSPRSELTTHVLRQPVYETGFLSNNGYYYPHHEYHLYGMPTYRGEYKPKPYYYSSGPSYNYYNDREPVSNPLDDLHEEILQEDEQERQTDMLGDDDYEEDYYIDPSENPHDTYTSNFLRNMIEYNRQKEKLQRLQQLQQHHQQREQMNEDIEGDEGHSKEDDYFSDIEVNPDEFQFEPKGEANFDVQKYWDAEMSSLANSATPIPVHHQRDNNDEDEEELKSLTRHDSYNDEDDYNRKRYHIKVKQAVQPQSNHNWRQEQTPELNSPQQQKEHEDDYSAIDYDDGSWINWDRKRSSLKENVRALSNDKFKSELAIRKRLLASSKKEQENSQIKSDLRPAVMSTKSPASSVSKTLGQKEKFPAEGVLTKPRSFILNENKDNSIIKQSKSAAETEQRIYDTIKQMISIQQELKKTGSKKRKRYIPDGASLVNQLDSLRKVKN